MAKIQVQDVSFTYAARPADPVNRLFGRKKDRLQEDLPQVSSHGITALDHVNLTIPNGRTFVIVGPSGCGKSTLLRVIAGLIKDYSGQIFYDGENVHNLEIKDRLIGMVFQGYALYPNFNSKGNLSFFFKMHDIPDEETRERIRYTSELMGIGFRELLPRKPGTLSGGEKQRVAIARAIVRAPRLLLLDEPLSNLDAKLRVQTRTEIKRLLRRFSITSLYVTHDQVEAIALADQMVVMHQGKVEQVGSYQDLMANPANLFVAGFLGLPPMNLFPGGFISGGKLILDKYPIPLPDNLIPRVQTHQLVTLGIRQEAVQVSGNVVSEYGIQVEGKVESYETDFVHKLHMIRLQTGPWTYSGVCPIDVNFRIGQPVYARLDPKHFYFFDTASGLRL